MDLGGVSGVSKMLLICLDAGVRVRPDLRVGCGVIEVCDDDDGNDNVDDVDDGVVLVSKRARRDVLRVVEREPDCDGVDVADVSDAPLSRDIGSSSPDCVLVIVSSSVIWSLVCPSLPFALLLPFLLPLPLGTSTQPAGSLALLSSPFSTSLFLLISSISLILLPTNSSKPSISRSSSPTGNPGAST